MWTQEVRLQADSLHEAALKAASNPTLPDEVVAALRELAEKGPNEFIWWTTYMGGSLFNKNTVYPGTVYLIPGPVVELGPEHDAVGVGMELAFGCYSETWKTYWLFRWRRSTERFDRWNEKGE